MRINSIQNTYYNHTPHNPQFKSWKREVFTHQRIGEIQHRNHTWVYRDYAFWEKLAEHLTERYKNIPKVNVYNFGCSNGSEAYTFLMQLMANYDPQTVKKFTPIIAKDYDKVAIDYAKSRLLPMDEDEIDSINKYTNNSFNKFFESDKIILNEATHFIPKSVLTDNVRFEIGDITKDLNKIKSKNTILIARNFLPYIPNMKQTIEAIGKHLKDNCTMIVGNYEYTGASWRGYEFNKLMYNAGFNQINEYIYEKDPKLIKRLWYDLF